MQRRTIDGVRSSIGVMHPVKVLDGCQAHHADGNGSDHLWLSYAVRHGLTSSPQILKKIVMDVARKRQPSTRVNGVMISHAQAEKNWAGEKGAFVHRLSDAEQAELINRVRPIGDKILGEDPKTKEIYALLKKGCSRHPIRIILNTIRHPRPRSGVFFVLQRCRKQRSKGST